MTAFSFVFIFYSCSDRFKEALWQGFLYGSVYFFLHSHGCVGLVEKNNLGQANVVFPLLFCLFYAFQAVLFFFLIALCKKVQNQCLSYSMLGFLGFMYLWWLSNKSLLLYGVNQGYPLLYPLTPIVNNALLRDLFYYCNIWPATLIIMCGSSLIAYGIQKRAYRLLFACITLLVGVLLLYPEHAEENYYFETKFVYNKPPVDHKNPYAILRELADMAAAKERNLLANDKMCLVFGESAMPYPFTKKTLPLLTAHFSHLGPQATVILGGSFKEKGRVYNSCYLIHKNRIVMHYKKKVLLPFGEYIPHGENYIARKVLGFLLNKKYGFSPGPTHICNFFYLDGDIYIPVLCSELFWVDYADYPPLLNIICLANDDHYSGSILPQIMFTYARFVAGTQRRIVVYVGHKRGVLIGKNGLIFKKL